MAMGYKVRKWTEDDYRDIANLYMQGETLAAIGRKYNVSGQTISARLKEMGFKKIGGDCFE